MRRERVWIAIVAAVVVLTGVAVIATRQSAGRSAVNASDETAGPTTSESTLVETTTTSASSTTVYLPPTTRVKVSTTVTVPTTSPRPLEFSRVNVTVGAPCHDPTTTTTNNGAGVHEIDGCFFFVYWPTTESDVHLRLASDRGFSSSLYGPPCQEMEGKCHGYMGIGPGNDRQVGEHECFWLTTMDPGWAPKSNTICIDWPQRA